MSLLRTVEYVDDECRFNYNNAAVMMNSPEDKTIKTMESVIGVDASVNLQRLAAQYQCDQAEEKYQASQKAQTEQEKNSIRARFIAYAFNDAGFVKQTVSHLKSTAAKITGNMILCAIFYGVGRYLYASGVVSNYVVQPDIIHLEQHLIPPVFSAVPTIMPYDDLEDLVYSIEDDAKWENFNINYDPVHVYQKY